jgi:hypothetical protein
MPTLGNDIVDLLCKDNRRSFADSRYLNKVLTISELGVVEAFQNISFLPALFWSCKESAYKTHCKQGEPEGFSPASFEVEMETGSWVSCKLPYYVSGLVHYGREKYFFHSFVCQDYIHTITSSCAASLMKAISYAGLTEDADPSERMKVHLRYHISREENLDISEVSISKTVKGIPSINVKGVPHSSEVSFSHDGRFFSWVYLQTKTGNVQR